MYKEDFALNNLQWLICHETKPTHNYKSETLMPYEFFLGGECLSLLYSMRIYFLTLFNHVVHLITNFIAGMHF